MLEKLCLQWNTFQEDIKSAFANLREDKDFKDVTLVCEDGQQVEAHKVILASSSPFFQKVLGRNKHPHPLIYMKGMKFGNLFAIMDFLYRGEANVVQQNLDSFLAVAEELQLRGLMGKTDERAENLDVDEKYLPSKVLPSPYSETKSLKAHPKTQRQDNKIIRADGNTVALPSNHSGDLEQLEGMVKSMMEKGQNKHANGIHTLHQCKVCGKEGMNHAIKTHIEANHIEGIVIPCNLCGKTFRSRNALKLHNSFIIPCRRDFHLLEVFEQCNFQV